MADKSVISDELAKSFMGFSDPVEQRVDNLRYNTVDVFFQLPIVKGAGKNANASGPDERALKLLENVVTTFSHHGLSAETPQLSDTSLYHHSGRDKNADYVGVLKFSDVSIRVIDEVAHEVSQEIGARKTALSPPVAASVAATGTTASAVKRAAPVMRAARQFTS